MKVIGPLLLALLLAACAREQAPTSAAPVGETQSPPATTPSAARTASASGTVEAVDAQAQVITIAHGPVEALEWPAMTMPFKAPGIDLDEFKRGDPVAFDFTTEGGATITRIERR